MKKQYATPRYKKSTRPGRKPIPQEQRRKTVCVRVAGDTYNHLIKHGLKAGREIDRLVRNQIHELTDSEIQADKEAANTSHIDESALVAEMEASDTITETARGLLALIVERGTDHLSREQVQILDDNFTLIVNNFLATFKKSLTTKVTKDTKFRT